MLAAVQKPDYTLNPCENKAEFIGTKVPPTSATQLSITGPAGVNFILWGRTTRRKAPSLKLLKLVPRILPIKVHSSIHHHSNVSALFEELHDFLSLPCQLSPA